MVHPEAELKELRRQRRSLTKWFLFALLFNVFLQFDFVEDYFNTISEDAEVVAANSEVCGSGGHYASKEAPRSLLQVVQSVASFGPQTNSSSKKIQGFFPEWPLFISKDSDPTGVISAEIAFQRFIGRISGLSPPHV